MPLFDTIVEGIAKLMGLEPERAPDRRERAQLSRAPSVGSPREAQPDAESKAEAEPALEDETNPAIEQLLEAAMQAIPKVVAVAAVDIERGRLVATRFETPLAPEVRERLAGATSELLGAPYFAAVECSLGGAELDESADSPTRQVIVLSTNLVHLFVRLERYPSLVLAVVCRANTNLGLTLARLRSMSA